MIVESSVGKIDEIVIDLSKLKKLKNDKFKSLNAFLKY